MEWEKLFDIAKDNKGDAATILICGAVGFVGDAVSTLHGVISPGYFAGVAASGGLGVKKLISARLDSRRSEDSAQLRGPNAKAKAEQLLSLTAEELRLQSDRERLRRSMKLFEGQILSIEDFETIIREFAEKYLKPEILS